MNSLLLDLQTALRFFARRRAAFAVIVLTMALALGANTAMFSVLKAFVFSSLAALGLVAAWFAARALQAQLTGFDAAPVWPYATVAAGVLGLTQLASYLPARRAAKLDVQTVLSSA